MGVSSSASGELTSHGTYTVATTAIGRRRTDERERERERGMTEQRTEQGLPFA